MPYGHDQWPTSHHDPLIVAVCFPPIHRDPWELKGLPLMGQINPDAVIRRLKGFGLDAIAHTRDVQYPTTKPTVLVIKTHARYTVNLEHNIETIDQFAEENYDEFDQLNDNAAQEFLFNSLEERLCVNLHKVIEASDCFISVWLRLMDLVISVSSAHHDQLREAIRKDLPKSYPGENITTLCDSFREKADELSRADQFNPVLILTMLENMSDISVTGSFPFQILDKHKEVKQSLDKSACLPRDEIIKLLHKAKLDYEHILKFASKTYNDLVEDKKWPPALSPSDSSTSSLAGLIHMSSTESISNAVFALLQKSIGNNSGLEKGQLGPCFKCGKLGHLARNCPDITVNKDSDSSTSEKKRIGNVWHH